MKFKHVATFVSKQGADHYAHLAEMQGYKVRVLRRQFGTNPAEYVVYQSRKKVD